MTIDIGNECVECRNDTSEGSGLFVNRIPAERQDGVDDELIMGYLCPECQLIECDKCGEPSDCSGYNNMLVCEDCVYHAGEKYLEEMTQDECVKFLQEKVDSFP